MKAAPNFLESSELDSYRTPHAFLREENSSEGTETPPDAQSLQEDNLIIDLSLPESSNLQRASPVAENEQ